MYLSPGQLLAQEKWCLALTLKSRDKTLPTAGQSHDLWSDASSLVRTSKHLLQSWMKSQHNCEHSLKGISMTTLAENGVIEPFEAGKKYHTYYQLDLVALFILNHGREGFWPLSAIYLYTVKHAACTKCVFLAPEAKHKPLICYFPSLIHRLRL